jgi:hypothetical protein
MRGILASSAWTIGLAGTALLGVAVFVMVPSRTAEAVPAFAQQTGLACDACHVGSFGPQLTPFGRAFKINGYTQRGGQGWQQYVPLSVMAMGSFTNVGKDYPDDVVPHHYNNNNNVSLDQVSGFVAGGIGSHTGGLIQFTWSDFDNTVVLDNTDLRPYTTTLQAFGNDLTVGLTVNNNPTVQDPYNSTFAWGYPFFTNKLEITPGASTLLAGAFAGNVIGVTAYAWYNEHLYVEAGAYGAQSPWLSFRLGTEGGPASNNLIPYLRAAYEWDWGTNAAWLGGTMLHANINPGLGTGQDSYTDYAVDGGYQFLGTGTHIVTVQGIFVHESQDIGANATSYNAANGTTAGARYGLNTININAQYWYKNTYGLTLGWQAGFGSTNPIAYPTGGQLGADFAGFANNSPNYNGFSVEADWVPFGKNNSFGKPWANLKVGAQYMFYTDYNGASSNYDGFGRNASDNNTFLLYLWTIF